LKTLGQYDYPDLGTFKEALDMAEEITKNHAGIISNKDAAEKLGYKVKDPQRITGSFYEKMKDLSSFGFFEKVRGAYKTTPLAEKALDPYDSTKANEGRTEAIRKIRVIVDAYTQWQGEVPTEHAFPAKIAQLTGISWIEVQKYADSLRKLFIEAFPYLQASPRHIPPPSRDEKAQEDDSHMEIENEPKGVVSDQLVGELRTVDYGTLRLRDSLSIDVAITILQNLKRKIKEERAS